jgi:hypothetical protein
LDHELVIRVFLEVRREEAYDRIEQSEYGHIYQGWTEGSDERSWNSEPSHVSYSILHKTNSSIK